jgi:4'-phosphopantetheinyl transferase
MELTAFDHPAALLALPASLSPESGAFATLSASLALAPNTVHVWGFELEGAPTLVDYCRGCLSNAERQRADRFVFARDRTHHTVAHGVMRHLLGRYCGIAPEALQFSVTAAGKPALVIPSGKALTNAPGNTSGDAPAIASGNTPGNASAIHFNLTHSGGRALLGVSLGLELGIDLEQVRPNIETLSISRNYFFGSERDVIENALSATRDNMFFRYWVAKEAVLKAQGIGLGFPLDQFRVDFLGDGVMARVETFDPGRLDRGWVVRMMSCEAGWLAAVAARGEDWVVKVERPVVTDPPHL